MTDLTKCKPETERHVIGAMLLDNRTISGIAEILEPGDFTDQHHNIIYNTILAQWTAGGAVTPASVATDNGEYVADIVWDAYSGVGSAVDAAWYAQRVKDAATRRDLMIRCKQIEQAAKTQKGDVTELVGDAQTRMYEIAHREMKTTITEDFAEIQRMSEAASKSKYGTVGVPTMFHNLDNITGGLKKQDLIVIAARPSIGKTAFATNVFQNIVEHTDLKAMFFSGEMSRHALLLRMASRRCQLDNNFLSRGNLTGSEWTDYSRACGDLAGLMEGRAWIDDKSRPSPGHIRATAKQRMQSDGLDIIFVDYLNIMSVPGKFHSTADKLSAITGGMKAIAKDLDIPVVLLAQINRGAENMEEVMEPGLGNLKGSGSIEEDADLIVFTHRPTRDAYHGKLIIAKSRNGPLDVIPVTYDGATTTFKEK